MTAKPSNLATTTRIRKDCAMVLALAGSAYLMAVAIESPHRVWLGWVTLLPLFYAIRVYSRMRAMAAGAIWGACLFASTLTFATTKISPTFASFALLSLIPAAYGYFGAALTRHIGFSPYLLALVWIGAEFALAPLGLRHGLLAGTQGDSLAVRLLGSAAGYALVAFLVAYVNAALLSVLTSVHRRGESSRLVRRSGGPIRSYFSVEFPCDWLLFHRAALPRAPPV